MSRMPDTIVCEICGSEDATFQPPGGVAEWFNDIYNHQRESELDEPSRLMYEVYYGLLANDTERMFSTKDLDRTKEQLRNKGWKVMCELCAVHSIS